MLRPSRLLMLSSHTPWVHHTTLSGYAGRQLHIACAASAHSKHVEWWECLLHLKTCQKEDKNIRIPLIGSAGRETP